MSQQNGHANREKKPFLVRGADGETAEIREFYINTKARGRRMMLNSLSSEARQVHACLEMGTMGYRQEIAVVQYRDESGDLRRRPMTPGDIAKKTGISRQHVRRCLAELEGQGLAARRAVDGGALRKGYIEICSWAVPKAATVTDKDCSHARLQYPAWMPESWHDSIGLFAKRNRIRLPEEIVITRGYNPELFDRAERVARDYKKVESEARALLNEVCALSNSLVDIRKKDRGKKEEQTDSGSVALVPVPRALEAQFVRSSPAPTVHEVLRAWLVGKFPLPTALEPDVFHAIARHIPDPGVLDQFCKAAENTKPRSWRVFIKIAEACEANREQYAAAAAANGRYGDCSPATRDVLRLMESRLLRGEDPL